MGYTDPEFKKFQAYARYSKDEEACLVRKALAGCEASKNRVVESMIPFLLLRAYSLSRKFHVDADDLVQMGLTKILEKFHTFNPDRGVRPISYLGLIGHREMIRYVATSRSTIEVTYNAQSQKTRDDVSRARKIKSLNLKKQIRSGATHYVIPGEDFDTDFRRQPTNHENLQEAQEIADIVNEILRPKHAQIFYLHYFYGLSYTKIAAIYDRSVPRIQQISLQSLRMVRDEIEKRRASKI